MTLAVASIQGDIEAIVGLETVHVEGGDFGRHVDDHGLRLCIEHFHDELLRESSIESLHALH